MTTLNNAKSPGQKIKIGKQVLCGIDAVDTTPIAGRAAAFQMAHQQYSQAEQGVLAASAALGDQRGVVAAADGEFGVAIEALAIALPSDGFERRQPFRAFGAPSPSAMRGMAFADGAQQMLVLEKAVLRHAGVSAKTMHVAQAAADAARTLLEEVGKLGELEKARTDAIAKRDAYAPAWERAFQNLKTSARMAEIEGFAGLFDALFERPAPARKPMSNKRKPPPTLDAAPLSTPG